MGQLVSEEIKEYFKMSVKEKLKHFSKFKKNWHIGQEGIPFPQEILDGVLSFWNKYIKDKYESNVFPGLGGEIALTIYPENGHFWEIIFEYDGDYTVTHEDADDKEISYQENLKYKNIVNIIESLGD